jgi:hypothetical protein
MSYIFNFRYKPNADLLALNEFIKSKKLKWKSRDVTVSGEIRVKFISPMIDLENASPYIDNIKNAGITIDSIECDNGSFIVRKNLLC